MGNFACSLHLPLEDDYLKAPSWCWLSQLLVSRTYFVSHAYRESSLRLNTSVMTVPNPSAYPFPCLLGLGCLPVTRTGSPARLPAGQGPTYPFCTPVAAGSASTYRHRVAVGLCGRSAP